MSCKEKDLPKFEHTYFQMSTVITVSIFQESPPSPALFSSIDSLLQWYDTQFGPSSSFSQQVIFNTSDLDTLVLTSQLWQMINRAQEVSDSIGGLFNVTLLPVKEFWKPESTDSASSLPSVLDPSATEKLQRLLSLCKRDNFVLLSDNCLYRRNRATKLDLGGVAKGYVLQAIADFLDSSAINNYLINAGGDVLAKGDKKSGPFIVGIQAPRSDTLLAILPLINQTIVTSGDYERFRIDAMGHRIHHLFDTRTGFPAKTNQSVTILSPDPIIADILSTGLFALPADSIFYYCSLFENTAALVVDSSGVLSYSPNFLKN